MGSRPLGLDQPALELHAVTWRLGFIDPFEKPLTLLDVLAAAHGNGCGFHIESQERVSGTVIEGAIVVRLGDGLDSSRYFALLPWSAAYLRGYVPENEYSALTHKEDIPFSSLNNAAYANTHLSEYTAG